MTSSRIKQQAKLKTRLLADAALSISAALGACQRHKGNQPG